MIIFRNPGLIDLNAVTTMGVSVKKPGSFGYFGTGLKFAVATILRGGGHVELFRGEDMHSFDTETIDVRGETFQRVTLDGAPLGFTTQLGRNWQPWMVLRELRCNALDEGGTVEEPGEGSAFRSPDETVFVVEWDELDAAWKQCGDLFVEAKPLWENETLRILPGRSLHLYYRGVRARDLPKQSTFTYDILAQQTLTEDRTLAQDWAQNYIVRQTLLGIEDPEIAAAIVTANHESWEASLGFGEDEYAPVSRVFIDSVQDAKDRKDRVITGALEVLQRHQRTQSNEVVGHMGHTRYEGVHDNFSAAVQALDDLGVEGINDLTVIIVDDLRGEALSISENNRVYVLRSLLRKSVRTIAEELLNRYVELTIDNPVEFFIPRLLDQHHHMKKEE